MGRLGELGYTLSVAFVLLALGIARADEGATSGPPIDDTGRLYFSVITGLHFTFDPQFAGDVKIEPPGGQDWDLGGGIGYNITRNWGVELQVLGIDPDLSSESRGLIREISVLNFVPAVRYRWPLQAGRLVPYVSGGVGFSSIEIHDNAQFFADAKTSSTTVVGSLLAGFDYFLSENVAAGLDLDYMIHPDQTAEVTYQNPRTGAVTRFTNSLNLSSISLLAHIRFFPGQQAAADGHDRSFFLADHGPFDTDELRVYLSGLFGYDFLFDKSGGAGVKLRDQGGDFNLTKGGALGVNFDGHWGAEIELLATSLNVRLATGPRFEKLNVFEVLPTVRYRWQLLEGRLVPFVTAGLGASFLDGNDGRPRAEVQPGVGPVIIHPHYDVGSPSLVGSLGVGIEYFLNHHLSVGLDVPFHFYPDQDTVLRRSGHATQTGSANFSGVVPLLQLKAYLP